MRIGHTDAHADQAHAAFDAGAAAITHIHNAHRRFSARDPGPAGAALARDDVAVTAIIDGVHLADETVTIVRRAAGRRLCVVSDAIAAAGEGDGRFTLGGEPVTVAGGRATRPDGTLAGSVGTLDAALRRLVAGGAGTARRRPRGFARPRVAGGPPRPRPHRARATRGHRGPG